ncbi:MAG: LytTR family transcriptional regulator DNA-binding domain-containing protein [Pseudonocardia sp.]|uniref:DNA-binding protein n=1 Tax=Pseudonocardia sp. TaxID=60912 RepID=UPI001AC7B633|nr:LytTR family transcriptional regulator DNA-binding domain-containing protein [Pseudonocardia sp.]MBN9102423.1 LytTR family transcriptional regulator DNA-binding domain-containing protein [Pseudonocardia sp.]
MGTDREHRRRTLTAWERFVSGEDDVQGIPPPILRSWHRCRDVHKIDPLLWRPTTTTRGHSHRPAHPGVFAQLGGIASALAEHGAGCLATVTDGEGQIVASWGTRGLRSCAADSGLAPFFNWSEAATGTNGMGTAILQDHPVVVRGPEHWCQEMHGWNCAGAAVYDAVTRDPVAALNISLCSQEDISGYASGIAAEMEPVNAGLREQAVQDGVTISREFTKAESTSVGGLLAIDLAGNVVAGNDGARALLRDLSAGFMVDPASRRRAGGATLRSIVGQAEGRAERNPDWIGSADLGTPLVGRPEMFSMAPVRVGAGVIGWLLSHDPASDGEELAAPAAGAIGRIAAVQGGQVLLLDPSEIRYAEASGHAVWLITDDGRVRAATRGMDNVDAELTPWGFLRTHRSYLVNLERVRRVDHRSRGILTLSTDQQRDERIPVSRRSSARIRNLLGL